MLIDSNTEFARSPISPPTDRRAHTSESSQTACQTHNVTRRSAFVGRRPRGSRTMCRWIFYYGEEVCIAKLIFGATHGLATMSEVRACHAPQPAAATVARNLTREHRPRPERDRRARPATSRAGSPRSSSFPAARRSTRRIARPLLTSVLPAPRRRLCRALDARSVVSASSAGRRIHPRVRGEPPAEPPRERARVRHRVVRARAVRAGG